MFQLRYFLIIQSCFLFSCATTKNRFSKDPRATFIAEYRIPNEFKYRNTLVGGLSGIDYNPATDEFYFISDDRSAVNPARFYTAKIQFSGSKIDSILFTNVTFLKNPQQKLFPRFADDSLHSCDPEDMRYNSKTGLLTWVSEGERYIRAGATYLQDPWVYNMKQDGSFVDSFMIPQNMHYRVSESGPRRNSTFEGLTYSPDFDNLFVSLEEPNYEDGNRAGTGDSSAWTRIVEFNTDDRTPFAQYAYRLDPVMNVPNPPGGFKINGISDILYFGKSRLLIVERSYSSGVKQNSIRVYLGDLGGATDVGAFHSLTNGNFKPIAKKLLLNMDSLGIYADNIEGVCLGPKLPNGKQSLIFISDNNFSNGQVTQLLLFQID